MNTSNKNLREKILFLLSFNISLSLFSFLQTIRSFHNEIREFSSFRSKVAFWTFRPVKRKLLHWLETSETDSSVTRPHIPGKRAGLRRDLLTYLITYFITYLLTYLLTYLFTYLLTYLLHGVSK